MRARAIYSCGGGPLTLTTARGSNATLTSKSTGAFQISFLLFEKVNAVEGPLRRADNRAANTGGRSSAEGVLPRTTRKFMIEPAELHREPALLANVGVPDRVATGAPGGASKGWLVSSRLFSREIDAFRADRLLVQH